jgi:hypothetical protein
MYFVTYYFYRIQKVHSFGSAAVWLTCAICTCRVSSQGRRTIPSLTPLERDDALYPKVTRSRQPMHWRARRTNVLTMDLGPRSFHAPSEGDPCGIDFIDDLKRYDR